jgi:hypothetical protein
MADPERIAVAAHLHVALRRRLSRVTDVEWMATNRDYATEVVRLCQASPHPDLHDLAGRLEQAWRGGPARREPAATAPPSGPARALAAEPAPSPRAGQYVNSLR